jgi:cell division protease FtsH
MDAAADGKRYEYGVMAEQRSSRPEQRTRGDPTGPQPSPSRFRFSPWWLALIVALFAINYWAGSRVTEAPSRIRVPYSPFFLQQIRSGNVAEITSKGSAVEGTFKRNRRYQDSKPTTRFETEIPSFADSARLSELLVRKGVVVNAKPLDNGGPWWETLLVGFGPTILFVFLLFWLMRRAGNAQNVLGSFGRSRARRYEGTEQKVSFADVAGIDEAEDELAEVVDFLRNPDRYRRLGARIPRGVLLSGPPGTGKTLLARAVAGEADVPFFSMAASEFVEAIVGVGAARVRDLFKDAKEAHPSIVFIDELDAIGRARTTGVAGFSGGNDEREQTLNQILTEMDGFDATTGVIVLAATNRPDVLDQALLRPGRFDRRVAINPPDRAGREAILQVHVRGVPLAPDVDLARVAATTPGMVGADLANLVNEAALLAARRRNEQVSEADFGDALERIVLGAARKVMLSADDRRRTAYHEGGHAIVGMLTPGADPVRKISIIPRGRALGVTFSAPEDDRFSYDREELLARIKVALGGRAAEELVFAQPTTGAESDFEQVTQIARHMVGRWGMSEAIGKLTVLPADDRGFSFPEVSPQTQQLIDEEARRIVEEADKSVVALLREHRDKLDSLAEALLEHETLDQDDAYAAAGISHVDRGPQTQLEAAAFRQTTV